MPTSPLRGCRHPGCPELVASGMCRAHQRVRYASQDRDRGGAAARGYDAAWARARRAFLASHPLCEVCAARGDVRAASVVDHVISIREDPSRRLDPANLRAMCKPCHDARTMRDQVPHWRR